MSQEIPEDRISMHEGRPGDELLLLAEGVLFADRERGRRLAAAPIEEKIAMLVRLQEMVAPILRARGRDVRPWTLDPAMPPSGNMEVRSDIESAEDVR